MTSRIRIIFMHLKFLKKWTRKIIKYFSTKLFISNQTNKKFGIHENKISNKFQTSKIDVFF